MREGHAEAGGVGNAPAASATPTPLGVADTAVSDPPVRGAATTTRGSATERRGGRRIRRRFRRRVGWPLRVLLLVAAVMVLLTLPVVVVLPGAASGG